MKNVRTVAVALLAISFIAVGCGDDDNSSSTPASTPTTASTPSTATPPPPAETTPTDTGTTSVPKEADAAVKAAIDSCKQSVSAQPTISEAAKTKLNTVCEKITDPEGAKEAIREVCTTLVEESQIPAGAAKDQALAACKTSTQ